MRAGVLLALCVGLAACGSAPKRPLPTSPSAAEPRTGEPRLPGRRPERAAALNHCLPTREHRDSDYTPGGLYAPGVADGAPAGEVDLGGVVEPVPRDEPRSRYGNRSPYTVLGKSYRVRDSAEGYVERGVASWYGSKFNGRSTSSGEIYDMCAFSAAHKTLPLPSFVRVSNLANGRSVIVRVNDRGPFHDGRLIDLSYAAAVRLGVDRTGTAWVELRAITGGDEAGGAAPPPGAASRPALPPPARAGGEDGARKIVQVASFADKENARRLADRLDAAGIDDVDLDHAEVDGRDVWRVRIGPVDVSDVEPMLARIRALGLPNPRAFSE